MRAARVTLARRLCYKQNEIPVRFKALRDSIRANLEEPWPNTIFATAYSTLNTP